MSTISTKGQTTIPEELRRELSLEPGHRLMWELIQGKLVATPTGDLMSLAGALKSDKPYLPKEEMRKILQEQRSKRLAKKLAQE
ncbi:MAG: hypothetical protein JNN07_28985 [Verrucomicrobiales bacterium]|nr:hypothetical protein [Verrucomicrobiales bacterium]